MRKTFIPLAILTIGLAACGSPEPEETVVDDTAEGAASEGGLTTVGQMGQATARLQLADGTPAGTATATESEGGILITLMAENIPAGEHGVHVHTTGACTPDFAAAGSHWNPSGEMHGLEDPAGQHAGDMPNLNVGEDGTGMLEYMLEGGATWAGLMDADGSAFVIHAGKDDQRTDPSGDSGDRLACGVFSQG